MSLRKLMGSPVRPLVRAPLRAGRASLALFLAFAPTVAAADGYDDMQLVNTFAIGVGAFGFMEAGFDPGAPVMPMWSVRYGWNPDPSVTWEWAYHGTSDAFDHPDWPLVGTLFETGVKLNMGVEASTYPIIGLGIGYMAFDGFPEETDHDMVTLPIMAGLEFVSDALVVSARATWRPTFLDEGLPFTSLGADSWSVTADLGTRF